MAEATWGRKETIIWPPHQPIYTLGAFFMALVFTGMLIAIRFTFALDPMEQFYLPAYIRASLIPSLRASGKYQMLLVSDGKGHSWYAGDHDVAQGETAQPNGKPIHAALSEEARKRGMAFLYRSAPMVYQDKALAGYLRQHVFDGASFAELFKWQLVFGALGLVLMVVRSIPKDIRRRKEMKYGRRLKGPVLVSPKEFNKAVAGYWNRHPGGSMPGDAPRSAAG